MLYLEIKCPNEQGALVLKRINWVMVTATMKDDDNTWCLQTAELLSAHVYF